MEGLKTRKRVRIRIICPICKNNVLKKLLKRHQQGSWCVSKTDKKKTNLEIPGPDFVRKLLENRRANRILIERYRENRQYDKRENDMGNVSHLRDPRDEFGYIAITGGREQVICPICKREVSKSVLPRHQKTEVCLKARDDLFKEKETIRS